MSRIYAPDAFLYVDSRVDTLRQMPLTVLPYAPAFYAIYDRVGGFTPSLFRGVRKKPCLFEKTDCQTESSIKFGDSFVYGRRKTGARYQEDEIGVPKLKTSEKTISGGAGSSHMRASETIVGPYSGNKKAGHAAGECDRLLLDIFHPKWSSRKRTTTPAAAAAPISSRARWNFKDENKCSSGLSIIVRLRRRLFSFFFFFFLSLSGLKQTADAI